MKKSGEATEMSPRDVPLGFIQEQARDIVSYRKITQGNTLIYLGGYPIMSVTSDSVQDDADHIRRAVELTLPQVIADWVNRGVR